MRVPFRCRSWRHAGACREWKGAQDFVRVAEAMETREHWNFLVLTFSQREWSHEWRQAREGVLCWSKLRKRIVREYGPFVYVQTWERHKRRGFHCNVAISSPTIYDITRRLKKITSWRWLIRASVACGFGWRCSAEPLRKDRQGLAGYLTKLSRELTGAGPKNQVPIQAPPHFRGLRASRGFLPPPYKSDYTGHLVRCPLESFPTLATVKTGRCGLISSVKDRGEYVQVGGGR